MDRFVQTTSKVIECTQNQSDQIPHTCTTIPPGAQINALFALRSTVSELWTVLSKLPQRSLSAPRIKSDHKPHASTTIPPRAQITLFLLYDQRFQSYGQFCQNYLKGHWVHPESKLTKHLMHVLLLQFSSDFIETLSKVPYHTRILACDFFADPSISLFYMN